MLNFSHGRMFVFVCTFISLGTRWKLGRRDVQARLPLRMLLTCPFRTTTWPSLARDASAAAGKLGGREHHRMPIMSRRLCTRRRGAWDRCCRITHALCGQTLNNDGMLSVWFNDEDCLAYVRDAYFLNR